MNAHEITDSAMLAAFLRGYGIPIETWGTGSSKTVDDLMAEIAAGESELLEDIKGVVRLTRVACVEVLYNEDGQALRLTEARQVFNDGRVRERKLEASVNEKLIGDEDSTDAAFRALKEELGIGAAVMDMVEKRYEEIPSPSYPGLHGRFARYFFRALIFRRDYRPEGYVHDDGKKKSYFVWKKAE